MANQPFDRTPLYPLERPLSDDVNRAASQLDRTIRDVLQEVFSIRASAASPLPSPVSGMVGAGFHVMPTSPVSGTVTIRRGLGFLYDAAGAISAVGGIEGLDDLSLYKPVFLSEDRDVVLSAAPAPGLERYDLIEVRANAALVNAQSRDTWDVGTGTFVATTLDNSLEVDLVDHGTGTVSSPTESTAPISVKEGVAAATGTAVRPARTPGYHALAYVYVAGGATTFDYDVIDDRRIVLAPGGVLPMYANFGLPSAAATFPVNVALRLPPGVRGTVVAIDAGGLRVAEVYVTIGDQNGVAPADADVGMSAAAMTLSTAGIAACNTFPMCGVVDAGLQALLGGPLAVPPLAVAVGQRVAGLGVLPQTQAGAVTGQDFTILGDPVKLAVSGFVYTPH